jgi:plasmid maintenance system antidote protein VapI
MDLLNRYRGIHPGFVLARLFEQKGIKQRPFALTLGEHPQTLNAICKGKRQLNTPLALKTETQLGLKEGTLVLLQAHHDIKVTKLKQEGRKPEPGKLRRILFWDTDYDQIQWDTQYVAVIKRVFERGNASEKAYIKAFYGPAKIKQLLSGPAIKPYAIQTTP